MQSASVEGTTRMSTLCAEGRAGDAKRENEKHDAEIEQGPNYGITKGSRVPIRRGDNKVHSVDAVQS